jgi:hypothetical protein
MARLVLCTSVYPSANGVLERLLGPSCVLLWIHFLFCSCAFPNTRLRRPPKWSSGQSSWLQIQRSRVDSRRYQIFWDVVGLERGPLSLVRIIEKLLEWKSSGSGQENRINGGGSVALTTRHPLSAKVGTNFADKRYTVGILRLRTKSHGV